MTILMCASLFSIGASFGFVIAAIFNNSDIDAPEKVRPRYRTGMRL
jgi:hypothetical protein